MRAPGVQTHPARRLESAGYARPDLALSSPHLSRSLRLRAEQPARGRAQVVLRPGVACPNGLHRACRVRARMRLRRARHAAELVAPPRCRRPQPRRLDEHDHDAGRDTPPGRTFLPGTPATRWTLTFRCCPWPWSA